MRPTQNKKPKYCLNANGEFVIENYNQSKPFANFFPGIAGKYGIPMWTFYVNRAQGIVSFGTKDKDHAILEFYPANRAWQMVSTNGFRTFLKITEGKKQYFYEPFHNGFTNLGFNLKNRMRILPSGLILEEENLTLKLKIEVEYFNIPNDTYAGLARILTITNNGTKTRKIQILDGLSQIVPFGTNHFFLKELGRTIEAWMDVENLTNNAPYFRLTVDPSDRPEVIHIKKGNFYIGFRELNRKMALIPPMVDPEAVFGPVTDLSMPQEFLAKNEFSYRRDQQTKSKTPCAFSFIKSKLSPKKKQAIYSIIGSVGDINTLNASLKRITSLSYLLAKKEENKRLISGLTQDIETHSSSKAFDLYCRQTYLDNMMRGGYPMQFDSENTFYLYSRKHGDLERDYNRFSLQATYFSQGNGNYRDLNQNRRNDIWFHPEIKEENLITFFNLLQADGFNPLVVKGVSFVLKDPRLFEPLLSGIVKESSSIDKVIAYLNSKPFTPGEVILFIEDNKIGLNVTYDEFLAALLANSFKNQEAEHGEGFWIDHWHYNLDLLETFISVYPEQAEDLIFNKKAFTYFDNVETVKPRSEKYIFHNGTVKQLHAIGADSGKKELIRKRAFQPHVSRSESGHGEVYTTTLINKLLCLFANKLASLDPFGMGIEMEADKPNWFDALNGLPALSGSSICETFELKRLLIFIQGFLKKSALAKIPVTKELYEFIIDLNSETEAYFASVNADKDFVYWDKTHILKEDYRHKTRLGFKGIEQEVLKEELVLIVENALRKIEAGIKNAYDPKTNTYCGYFINEVVLYDLINEHFVRPKKFKQKKLPLYLEGQMHALRLARNIDEALMLYQGTKRSQLYDKKLKMYKVTAPLRSMPEEIGRCRIFTPGWLENESIWLHMEYKYMLETLKQGLYEEFFADFKNALIPFQDPQRYGRSILENSSFLVSSAFPDEKLHGNGFVARLSGSTAEFIHIWLMMNIGKEPFYLNNNGKLYLRLSPVLAGWLFDRKGEYTFKLLSKIRVTYHNPKRLNTFGKNGLKVTRIIITDKSNISQEFPSASIPPPYSEKVRKGEILAIDAFLA